MNLSTILKAPVLGMAVGLSATILTNLLLRLNIHSVSLVFGFRPTTKQKTENVWRHRKN